MARTESLSIQVHPNDEQSQINLMQRFYWELSSSQEIKTVDSSLEKRGDKIYSVTKSENYIKLVFKRDLSTPNLDKIKKLENEYFSLNYPSSPGLKGAIILMVIGLISLFAASGEGAVIGFGVIAFAGGIFWLVKKIQKRNQNSEIYLSNDKKREEILSQVDNL